jgi:predicted nuclease with RNAse H fold
VLLSAAAEWIASERLGSAEELAAWVSELLPAGGVMGIDAPIRTSEGLLQDPVYRAGLSPVPPEGRYHNYRVCDFELARRGLPLYLVPTSYPHCPGWMRAGFAAYDALLSTGSWSLFEGGDPANRAAEVYPFAVFSVLLGQIPPAKQTPAGRTARLAALMSCGLHREALEGRSHHELDAAAAAVTALALGAGRASWVGTPREALIVLPGPLKERYRRG